MQSPPVKVSPKVKREEASHLGDASKLGNDEESNVRDASSIVKQEKGQLAESSSPSRLEDTLEKPLNASLLGDDEEVELQIMEQENQSYDNGQNQLVLYNPEANGTVEEEPQPVQAYAPAPPSRVLPSVGAFTVQCASCFKWRLIPTKEKYEEIRESILQIPFVCEIAREWRPDISCDDPADISQDGSRVWAIDKPNISQPPQGWKRELRIRGEGSTRFADVYYMAPSGKRFRSMVEIQKYLLDHPEYLRDGVNMSQFSFQIPKPLQEDYVRKRPRNEFSITRHLEPSDVNPLSWASPLNGSELQLGQPGMSATYEEPVLPKAPSGKKKASRSPSPLLPMIPLAGKKKARTPSKHKHKNHTPSNQPLIKVEEPQL
ncbi:hypothetical protein IFM89_037349 [Coptis chinensis]|uniref:Methyl-CpG-binding domain-containing protein 2 n=1 Tax=Coptis chinensis TaxID=261450 RepID=A0A835IJI7_9MAGN|nr:hypothetical protein IFM89_037349 [Coptis chinensis]